MNFLNKDLAASFLRIKIKEIERGLELVGCVDDRKAAVTWWLDLIDLFLVCTEALEAFEKMSDTKEQP